MIHDRDCTCGCQHPPLDAPRIKNDPRLGKIKSAEFLQEAQGVRPSDCASESRGLGDTIAKLTHAAGLDKLAEAYTRLTGNDCGCDGRRERLNLLVPYKNLHLD